MIYRTQGPLRYYYLVSRLLLTVIFSLFAAAILKDASAQSWVMTLGGLVMVFMAIYAAYESRIYLNALLNPVILTIADDGLSVNGLGCIPIPSLRVFSFSFFDFNFGFPGMVTLVNISSLAVAAEIDGQIKTRTFRILPERCMNMHVHEVLSALAAHYPGIKKVRKEKARGYADVFLDFGNYRDIDACHSKP